jgi:hypothetical protein
MEMKKTQGIGQKIFNRVLEEFISRRNQDEEINPRKVAEILEDGTKIMRNEIKENGARVHEMKDEIINRLAEINKDKKKKYKIRSKRHGIRRAQGKKYKE